MDDLAQSLEERIIAILRSERHAVNEWMVSLGVTFDNVQDHHLEVHELSMHETEYRLRRGPVLLGRMILRRVVEAAE